MDGIPVLINEHQSVFTIDDFTQRRNTTLDLHRNRLERTCARLLPRVSANLTGRRNYQRLVTLLLQQSASPRVLVVGGSILGEGMEVMVRAKSIELVETDVSFGPRTMLICDAHSLPFDDASFDGVVAQAVLEHVADPVQCVEEFHRVLKENGLVYAETPFMVPVHMGRYDFTRFTHLGHRRLFRRYDEIDSGVVCGPGAALAWCYQQFLLSFTSSRACRAVIKAFARITSFYLKYFDWLLLHKPSALDGAAGFYFLGRKTDRQLSDRELLSMYRGAG